ncbi:unnamed protein product [Dovyalis caffra]|uniref:Pectinesterase inhibitor domain-containing protein n=1 Tax=Dovyalis caffra TaxID=77055 RepID=A0AAV1RFZ2_9ROSI|nr:unnamed protein product [Dovyalis caffra]
MATITHCISFSAVFLATITILCAGQVTASDFCKGASYKPLCRSLAKGFSNAEEATKASINNLIVQTYRARASASRLGKDQKAQTCVENYDDAIDSLKKSLKFLQARDKGSVRTFISASISAYSTCTDAYEEFGVHCPFSRSNTLMEHTASSCLSIYSNVR